MKERTSITLRSRILPSGRSTLYLDFICNGRRRTESLKLFLEPETSRTVRQKNRETLNLAEAILAKRKVQIQNHEFGFRQELAVETKFYDYYKGLCDIRREGSNGNLVNWCAALLHMECYDPQLRERKLSEITTKWIQGFIDYLEKRAVSRACKPRGDGKNRPLARNTRVSYLLKLHACLNQAHKEGIISNNPMRGMNLLRNEETKRMYLTIDEVRKLANTPCSHPVVRRAFLFSCLTGLRHSDIRKLTWGEVQKEEGFTRIIFSQKKTGELEYLDLSPQAVTLMGIRGKEGDKVFPALPSASYASGVVKRWVARVGIRKRITFHCARHTFATMMLNLGTDIYTVSKLLGHRELATTQIYAKVIDKNKRAAVARIPNVLGEDAE